MSPEERNYRLNQQDRDRQRARDMQAWQREGLGSGCSLPPCGCVWFVLFVVVVVFFGCFAGDIMQKRCGERSKVACVLWIMRGSPID